MFDTVCGILRDQFNFDDIITLDMNIRNDFGADLLDVVELILKVENVFDISILDDDMEKVETVGDAVNLINSIIEGEL